MLPKVLLIIAVSNFFGFCLEFRDNGYKDVLVLISGNVPEGDTSGGEPLVVGKLRVCSTTRHNIR